MPESMPTPEKALSYPERQEQLREAARRYLAGEIDSAELTRIRRRLDGLERLD